MALWAVDESDVPGEDEASVGASARQRIAEAHDPAEPDGAQELEGAPQEPGLAIAGHAARGITGIMPPGSLCRCLPSSAEEFLSRAA
jgi:hypothetical protein